MGSKLVNGKDDWLPSVEHSHPITIPPPDSNMIKVSDLIDQRGGCWDEVKLHTYLWPVDCESVRRITLQHLEEDAKLMWRREKSGFFSVRSCCGLILEGKLMLLDNAADFPTSDGRCCCVHVYRANSVFSFGELGGTSFLQQSAYRNEELMSLQHVQYA